MVRVAMGNTRASCITSADTYQVGDRCLCESKAVRSAVRTSSIIDINCFPPGWIKAFLPRSALKVEEEAWNAYPYTKTRYTCPFVEKFYIEIETRYFNDAGHQDNVFELTSSDISNRTVGK